MIDHIVEDAIKRIAKGFTKEETLSFVCPGVFEKVCDDNHWYFEYDPETNGWDIDWWANIMIDKQIIRISGTMYYGTAQIYIM